jgi:hypothetical protein
MGHYLLQNAPKTGTGDLLVSVQAIEPIRVPYIKNYEWFSEKLTCVLVGNNSQVETDIANAIYELYNLSKEEIHFIESQCNQ